MPILVYLSNLGMGGGGVVQTGGGGDVYYDHRRRRVLAHIRAERERLGKVPQKVEAVIRKVAKEQVRQVDRVLTDRTLNAALHRALERKALAYRAYYAEVLRLELERMRLEDEEIVLLLLLH